MTKNVKVRATFKGTMSLMREGSIKEEGQLKIHHDVIVSNISYEEWMQRYDNAMVLLKTGLSTQEDTFKKLFKEADNRHKELVKKYENLIVYCEDIETKLKTKFTKPVIKKTSKKAEGSNTKASSKEKN